MEFVCFEWVLEQTANCALQNIKRPVFITEVRVFTARYGLSPGIAQIRFVCKRLTFDYLTKTADSDKCLLVQNYSEISHIAADYCSNCIAARHSFIRYMSGKTETFSVRFFHIRPVQHLDIIKVLFIHKQTHQ